MKKAVGLVAVRMKSDRLKEKALADLDGKPLIVRLFERVSQSKLLEEVVLCTSTHSQDDAIEEVAKKYQIPFFRGSEKDVMKRFLDCIEKHPSELVVRITGDNPLTDPENIDRMIDSHLQTKAEYTRTDGLPNGVTAEVISTQALRKAYELAEDSSHSEYMTWYFTKTDYFRLNILQAPPTVNRSSYRLTVDFKEDLELLCDIYKNFDFDVRQPSLEEVVSYLDSHPKLVSKNQSVPQLKIDTEINTRLRIK